MDSYVVKIHYKGAIRRFTLGKFSFEMLQTRIRDTYQFPSTSGFQLTYVDKDDDVIMLVSDEDLKDALVFQKLNPLRVKVEAVQSAGAVETGSPVAENGAKAEEVKESVTKAEPVVNSGESTTVPEEVPSTNEGVPEAEEKPSSIEGISEASSAAVEPATETVQEGEGAAGEKNSESDKEAKDVGANQIHYGITCDKCEMIPIKGSRFKSIVKPNYDLCGKCYAESGAKENEYVKVDRLFYRIGYPGYLGRMSRMHGQGMCERPELRPDSTPDAANAEKKSGEEDLSGDTTKKVVHPGVQCDECGMLPIEGARFKSTVRFNYDLCRSCFEKSGSDTKEYARVEEPVVPRGYPILFEHILRRGAPWGVPRCGGPRCGGSLSGEPFSSRGVWILNQLVQPEADQASAEGKSQKEGRGAENTNVVQIPVVFNNEVDFDKNSASETETPVDLQKLPTENGPVEEEDSIPASGVEEALKETVVVDNSSQPAGGERGVEGAAAVDDSIQTAGVEETVQIPVDSFNQTPAVEESVQEAVENAAQVPEIRETVQTPAADGSLSTLEGMLAKLAAMGFEDAKLNEELLQKNNFDLRKVLDDLCEAEEWDPILGELQEMGFYDDNMNRRLMFKNNGSVKRVVKELVQMYKGETKA